MIRKHAVLICLLITSALLIVAVSLYPGGSLHNKHAAGFTWSENFFSNLFGKQALNGAPNPAQPWAITGMAFHAVAYGLFFLRMSKKMPVRQAVIVLKTVGFVNIVFSFLIATPLHDIMVTLSSTLFLLGLFYITVFLFTTKLHWLKLGCVLCLCMFYFSLYLYGSGNWGLLAIMQKVSFMSAMLLVLALEYGTNPADFLPRKQP